MSSKPEYFDNVSSVEAATDIVVGEAVTVSGKNAQLARSGQTEWTYENTVLPGVSGTPQVGQVLIASAGSWTPSGATYSYEWLAGGDVPIPGVTAIDSPRMRDCWASASVSG